MQYKLSMQIIKNLIYLVLYLLFFFILVTFIFNNVQANLKNNFVNFIFNKDNFIKKYNYKEKKSSNDHEIKSNEETIVVNSSIFTHLPIVFTYSPMKYLQSSDVTEYLKNIPGFSSIRSGGINSDLIFRGMFGSQIRTLMDNGEILGACCSRMDPANSYICTNTFDILNIIKGPQTVLLGPVASGGILQFERHCPYFERSGIKLRSSIMVGSNNKVDKSIDSVVGNQHGCIRLMSNVAYSDDYKDGNKCRVHSSWYKWNTDAIFLLNLNLDTTFEINIGQGNGNANYAAKAMDGLCFDRENYSLKIKSLNISNILDKIELYTWYNYVNHIMGNAIRKSMILSNTQRCGCKNNNVDRCIWGARGIISGQWKNVECFSGVDSQINRHRKIGCHSTWKTDLFSKDTGIFSELIFLNTLSNKKFIGGIRLDHYSLIHANSFECNKKFDVIYPAGFLRYENNVYPSLLYYIGIGTSKRFPDYWEFYYTKFNDKKNGDLNDILNQSLHPERTIQLDTGAYFQGGKVNGWVSSYAGYTKNFILYYNYVDTEVINCLATISNINAKIYGAEAVLEYQYNKNWCIKSNITWTKGINVANGCVLPKIPPVEGTLKCQWQKECFNAILLWRIVSGLQSTVMNVDVLPNQMTLKNYIKTPGFGVLSANMLWVSSKYYLFSMGIDNLLNRSYREYLSLFHHERLGYEHSKVPIYEPGRVFWLKTEIKL